ncbi:permease [Corynebacterium renale]|nr:permease [Corynebacterium renale]
MQSTNAALFVLPDSQADAGSGVYKMASSLGAAFGNAIPTDIFTAFQNSGSRFLSAAVEFTVNQENVAVREAGMLGLGAIRITAIIALSSIIIFVSYNAGNK